MTEKNENQLSENLLDFDSLLQEGSYEEAHKYLQEKSLSVTDIFSFVQDVFNELKKTGEITKALKLATTFSQLKIETKSARVDEWNRLNLEGSYEKAANWAKEQDLSNIEIERSAKLAYSKYIKDGKVKDALRIMDRFKLSKEDLLEETITEFKKAYKNNEYHKVALLGKQFELSAQTTYSAASHICQESIINEKFKSAVEILTQFDLLSDDSLKLLKDDEADKLLDIILNDFISKEFLKGNVKTLLDMIKRTNILKRYFKNKSLKNFVLKLQEKAIVTHNSCLDRNEVKSAQYICDEFNLLSAPVPKDIYTEFIKASERFHHELLKNDKLDEAITFKNTYQLFDPDVNEESYEEAVRQAARFVTGAFKKRSISVAKSAIKEYKIPEFLVHESLCKAVEELASFEKYDEMFNLLHEIKLDTTKRSIVERVLNIYHTFMGQKDYIMAAEFSKILRLHKSFFEESSYKAWEKEFISKKFDKAIEVRRKYRISKKRTMPAALQMYWHFVNQNELHNAISVRKTYGVPVSFFQRLREFIMMLFSKPPADSE